MKKPLSVKVANKRFDQVHSRKQAAMVVSNSADYTAAVAIW